MNALDREYFDIAGISRVPLMGKRKPIPKNPVITQELIEAARTPAGGFSAARLWLLGVSWPPKKGWRKRIEGKPISRENYCLIHGIPLGPSSDELLEGGEFI